LGKQASTQARSKQASKQASNPSRAEPSRAKPRQASQASHKPRKQRMNKQRGHSKKALRARRAKQAKLTLQSRAQHKQDKHARKHPSKHAFAYVYQLRAGMDVSRSRHARMRARWGAIVHALGQPNHPSTTHEHYERAAAIPWLSKASELPSIASSLPTRQSAQGSEATSLMNNQSHSCASADSARCKPRLWRVHSAISQSGVRLGGIGSGSGLAFKT